MPDGPPKRDRQLPGYLPSRDRELLPPFGPPAHWSPADDPDWRDPKRWRRRWRLPAAESGWWYAACSVAGGLVGLALGYGLWG
jgi:hypothetical protein